MFFGKKASLIPLPQRFHIPLQTTLPRNKTSIGSRFLSCKMGKIRNVKRVCQFNLCIAVLAIEGDMELIIKSYLDTVDFGVV